MSPPRPWPCSPYHKYHGFCTHEPPVPGPPVIMHCSNEVKAQVRAVVAIAAAVLHAPWPVGFSSSRADIDRGKGCDRKQGESGADQDHRFILPIWAALHLTPDRADYSRGKWPWDLCGQTAAAGSGLGKSPSFAAAFQEEVELCRAMGPSSVQSDDRRAIVALSALRNAGFTTSRRFIIARKGSALGSSGQRPEGESNCRCLGPAGLLWTAGRASCSGDPGPLRICGIVAARLLADAMPTLTTSTTADSRLTVSSRSVPLGLVDPRETRPRAEVFPGTQGIDRGTLY